ncbi:MAG: hypothetical protein ABEJ92_05765 [Halobacteriales archaeon]
MTPTPDTPVDDPARSSGAAKRLGDLINHDHVIVRFVALWTLCFGLFLAAWTLSYLVLPEGLLRRSGGPGPLSATAATVEAEFVSLVAWNLGFSLLVVAANLFRSIRTPMGYLVVLVMWLQGAVVWGTNSLAIQTGRLAPSLSVILDRSGVFELTALVAIAVATRGVMVWHQRRGPRWREEFVRVGGPRDWSIGRREALVLVGGLALLALANLREAAMIVSATS